MIVIITANILYYAFCARHRSERLLCINQFNSHIKY